MEAKNPYLADGKDFNSRTSRQKPLKSARFATKMLPKPLLPICYQTDSGRGLTAGDQPFPTRCLSVAHKQFYSPFPTFLMKHEGLCEPRKRNAHASFLGKEADALLKEVRQTDFFAEEHQKVVTVYHEERGRFSSRDCVSCTNADVIERNENATREGGLAFNLSPKNKQVRLGEGVALPFRFQEIDLAVHLKRAVDLVALSSSGRVALIHFSTSARRTVASLSISSASLSDTDPATS